jgi:excinuclease UvrABC nuclease subunit
MESEYEQIQLLFKNLCEQREFLFPQHHNPLSVPSEPGVYIIRHEGTVLHVGRTLRGQGGLNQRLRDHLRGGSSFTREYLDGDGATLRNHGYTYQYLVVKDPRERALLEAYTAGVLCPKHIGLGKSRRDDH